MDLHPGPAVGALGQITAVSGDPGDRHLLSPRPSSQVARKR
jgi:hypothetical protein